MCDCSVLRDWGGGVPQAPAHSALCLRSCQYHLAAWLGFEGPWLRPFWGEQGLVNVAQLSSR